jgi:stalled ribosome rescue protein Dom34
MSPSRVAVHIDHHKAEVLSLDADNVQIQKIKAHEHFTRQHGSEVRTEHEFFADVCKALAAGTDVLVVGSHTAQADFRHYVDKHQVGLAKNIVGWQTVDHPTEGQLLALVREFFIQHDDMARTRTRM